MPVNAPIHAIDVQDLSFAYDGNPILEHVSFTIEKGDYVGIVGPNGGGKTTLLKILIGLLAPQQGRVRLHGRPIGAPDNRFAIGYVPQRISQENLHFPATVYEMVESGRIPRAGFFHRLGRDDRRAIDQALAAAQIDGLRNQLLGNLSGGQRQRVYVARALAAEPELLMLDEPFVGIDPAAQADFYAFLKELNQQRALTILFVSHDLDMIAAQVKTILCLNRGLLCVGEPSMLHDPHVIETLYGKHITHIHPHHA